MSTDYDVRKEIQGWLDETPLTDPSKEILFNDALTKYKKIIDYNLQENHSQEPKKKENAIAALRLACEENSCAIGNTIPKSTLKYLSSARKTIKLKHGEAIDKLNTMGIMLKADKEIMDFSKRILEKYKEKHEYSKRNALVTAASAIYISSIMKNKKIDQNNFRDILNITGIGNCYSEIVEALDIDLEPYGNYKFIKKQTKE